MASRGVCPATHALRSLNIGGAAGNQGMRVASSGPLPPFMLGALLPASGAISKVALKRFAKFKLLLFCVDPGPRTSKMRPGRTLGSASLPLLFLGANSQMAKRTPKRPRVDGTPSIPVTLLRCNAAGGHESGGRVPSET